MIFYVDAHSADVFSRGTIFLIEDTYMTIESISFYNPWFCIGSIEWYEYPDQENTSEYFHQCEMPRSNQKWEKYEYEWKCCKKSIHPKEGDEIKSCDKCPEDASECPYRRHIPDRRSARGELIDAESYRIWRYHPEKYTCRKEEDRRCYDRSYANITDGLTQEFEKRFAYDIGDCYSEPCIEDHIRKVFDPSIFPIGKSSTDIVSDREAREDDPDHRGPYECGGPIVGSEDACTDDFIREYDKAREKYRKFENIFLHREKWID